MKVHPENLVPFTGEPIRVPDFSKPLPSVPDEGRGFQTVTSGPDVERITQEGLMWVMHNAIIRFAELYDWIEPKDRKALLDCAAEIIR